MLNRRSARWLSRHEVILWLGLYAGASLAILISLSMWGHDVRFHLVRAEEIHAAMREGNLHLVFSQAFANGRPLPTYVYYPQWIYWPPSALMFLGLSAFASLKWCYGALLVILLMGCWRLFRACASVHLAVLTTLLFMTSNYVVGLVFERAAYGELCASAFVPWAMYLANKPTTHGRDQVTPIEQEGRVGINLPVVLALSLIILSHPLTFMNCAPLLAVWILLFDDGRTVRSKLARLVSTCALALLLTCFSWLPAVIERRYVRGEKGLGAVPRFAEWIPSLDTAWDFRTPGFAALLAANVAVLMLVFWRFTANERLRAFGLLICVVVYFALLEPWSAPLWKVTVLKSNIFAWRLLFPATLSLVLFVTIVASTLPSTWLHPLVRAPLCLLLLAHGLGVSERAFRAHRFTSQAQLDESMKMWRDRLQRREKGFGVSEYLPNLKRVPRAPEPCAELHELLLFSNSFAVPESARTHCLALPLYWSPRYRVTIDSVGARPYAHPKTGSLILFPNGHVGVGRILLKHPPYVWLSQVTSMISALLLFALWLRKRAARRCPASASTGARG